MGRHGTSNVSNGHAPPAYRVRTAAARLSRGAYLPEHRQDLAQAFGVSPSAISHRKNGDHKDPLTNVCEAIMRLEDDTAARALVSAAECAYESREMFRAETSVLLTRYCELWNREHELDAAEDRAAAIWMGGGSGEAYDAALRRNALVLELLALMRDELEQRGVDVRAALLRAQR